jgi:hypothetical protein
VPSKLQPYVKEPVLNTGGRVSNLIVASRLLHPEVDNCHGLMRFDHSFWTHVASKLELNCFYVAKYSSYTPVTKPGKSLQSVTVHPSSLKIEKRLVFEMKWRCLCSSGCQKHRGGYGRLRVRNR